AAFPRAAWPGRIGVPLGIYPAARGLDPAETGAVVTAGLAGAAVAALAVTLAGDRVGPRRALVAVSAVGAAGGVGLAAWSGVVPIVAAAFVGMVNGMGRDRGAALILDQAVLPATAADDRRTAAFARYNVVMDAGHAVGALLAGAPALVRRWAGWSETVSLRAAVLFYAALLLVGAVAYAHLSVAGRPSAGPRPPVSPASRRILWKISALFGVDALAGGFLTSALLAFFLYERFDVSEGAVGALFFGARAANAGSHLAAAWLARRIGLVRTMVFTHIPSSLLLATVAIAPTFPVAAVLFLLREGLVEMDVPTRQSYLMAVVRPEERTFASGVTHLVRLGGWAVAPAFAGLLMQGSSLAAPLIVGAAMKIAYDVLLYLAFRAHRPPEESR